MATSVSNRTLSHVPVRRSPEARLLKNDAYPPLHPLNGSSPGMSHKVDFSLRGGGMS